VEPRALVIRTGHTGLPSAREPLRTAWPGSLVIEEMHGVYNNETTLDDE